MKYQYNILIKSIESAQRIIPFSCFCLAAGLLSASETPLIERPPESLQTDTNATLTFTSGAVSTFVGQDSTGFADGVGTSAQFSADAQGIAFDGAGNLYIADNSNHRIRKISSSGYVSTLAGSGTSGYLEDTGASALMDNPQGVACYGGLVYFADTDNHVIRSIDSGGTTSRTAGQAGSAQSKDGNQGSSKFHTPTHMAVDSGNHYIYVLDSGSDQIRKLDFNLATNHKSFVTTFVSSGLNTSGGGGMVVDSSGNLYIADTGNHCIKKITSGGSVTVFAGSAGTAGDLEGTGGTARFDSPTDITIDEDDFLYVTDAGNHKIKRISSSGDVMTLTGTGTANTTDGDLFTAEFASPHTLGFNENFIYIKQDNHGRIRQMVKPDHFWVADPDSASISVTLTAGNGVLTIDLSEGGSLTAGSNGSASFTVEGLIDQLNAAFATLEYDHDIGFSGTDTITYSATDGTNSTGDATVDILVRDNNAPVLSSIGNFNLANHTYDVNHDFTVSDADGDPLTVTAMKNSGDADVTLTDNGSGNWNIFIDPDNGFVGVISMTITVTDVYDTEASETFFVNVNFTNSAPVLSAIGDQSTDRNVTKTISLSATDTDGDPLTYLAVVNSGNVTATVLGTDLELEPEADWGGIASITVTVEDGAGGSDSETFDLTVYPLPQILTFNQDLSGKTYGDAGFTLSATVDTGLPITFSSADISIVQIAGTTASIVGGGTVDITAEQAGNSEYAYTSATQSMTVARANQTITFPAMEDQYESSVSMALPAFASSGLTITYSSSDISIVSISGISAIFHHPGTVTITASQPGDSNYLAAPDETGSLTVIEEVQIILFPGKGEPGSVLRDFVLTHLAFQLPLDSIPGGNSGNPVVVSVTGGTAASGVRTETIILRGLRYLDVYSTSSGTVQFTATQDGGSNNGLEYAAATPVTQVITILQPSLANYRLAMREHPDYDTMYADFSAQYVGRINPDTGYLYTPSEIQSLFEGDSTDLDKDGVCNLLEYAYGADSLCHTIRERKVFPQMKPLVRTGGGLKKARYQFYRRTSASDPNLSYVVERTNDMYNWTTSGLTEVSAHYTDGDMEVVTVEFDQAYNDPGAPKFMILRLNVTSAE